MVPLLRRGGAHGHQCDRHLHDHAADHRHLRDQSVARGLQDAVPGPDHPRVATEAAYWQNTYDPEAEWGPAFHDVSNNVVFSGTYELPFGSGKAFGGDWSGPMNAILGGWRIGGIFQARSGLPITVIDGRNRSLQGERGAERPNCLGDPVPADQSINRWLDIDAFEAVPLGTFGNCPVGVARAPGYSNIDLMLRPVHARGVRLAPGTSTPWPACARLCGREQRRQVLAPTALEATTITLGGTRAEVRPPEVIARA